VDVTISIVNHESRETVLKSLAALAGDEARAASVEVIVVDNASSDGSVDAVRAAFPDVEVVPRRQRAGYGANHNVSLRRARGRYVLLLNDDVIVGPGAIDAMCRALDRQPEVAVAAPEVRTPRGDREPTLWPRPSASLDVRTALRLGRAREVRPGSDTPAGWATGCALMVRRDAVVALGGFDEGYFMYSEEIDLCTRLHDAGHRVVQVGEATVVHEGQASTGLESPERAVEMARSRRRYWRQHYARGARLVAQLAVAVQFLGMALSARLRGRPASPLLLQATGCFSDLRPGLRELAEDFNRRHAT
jgi:N-acetylglucosaminyl-diphospho-decaprenol L-rhamnosyltransferase